MSKRINTKGIFLHIKDFFVIVLFLVGLVVWPLIWVAIFMMWFLASWSKKTKIILTSVFVIPTVALVAGVIWGLSFYSSKPEQVLGYIFLSTGMGVWGIIITSSFALVLSLLHKTFGLGLAGIWKVTSVIITIIIILMIISFYVNGSNLYSISK